MYIKEVLVKNFWRRGDMLWRLDEDVNVLVGANGSGKSTILNLMYEALQPQISEEAREKYFSLVGDVLIEMSEDNYIFVDSSGERNPSKINSLNIKVSKISTFDIAESLDELIADQRLNFEIYLNQTRKKLEDKFLSKENISLEEDDEITKAIDRRKRFSQIINSLFTETGKSFNEDSFSFKLAKQELELSHTQLSSGEKQLFYILLKTLIQDGKPHILLMDEPEISLHVNWQHSLINYIQELNSMCQVIIVTHSPSMFYRGWSDKMQKIESIQVEARNSILIKIDPHLAKYDKVDLIKTLKKLEKKTIKNANEAIHRSFVSLSMDLCKYLLSYIEKEMKLKPDLYTFTILISKTKNIDDAKELFNEMKRRKIAPSGVTYTNLLKKANTFGDALSIFEEMEANKISPEIQHFSTILGKARTTEDVDKVEELRTYAGIDLNEVYAKKLRIRQ